MQRLTPLQQDVVGNINYIINRSHWLVIAATNQMGQLRLVLAVCQCRRGSWGWENFKAKPFSTVFVPVGIEISTGSGSQAAS